MKISDFVLIPLEFKISISTKINETNTSIETYSQETYNFCHSSNMLNIRSHGFVEVVAQRCSVKNVFLEIRKTPVPKFIS